MQNCCVTQTNDLVVPIIPVYEAEYESWLARQESYTRNWLQAVGYQPKSGTTVLVPNSHGGLDTVFIGMNNADDLWVFGQLAATLPKGCYQIRANFSSEQINFAALAWALGAYQFVPYKKCPPLEAKLLLSAEVDQRALQAMVTSNYLVRDLINTPPEDMTPADLAEAAVKVAEEFGASVKQIMGDDLLAQGYPTIHAVGRGSDHLPILIDFTWGNPQHPKVTLVGKGVCFDTGGLDLKSASGMALMKKDMAGAAQVLGLARLIMAAKLPIRLRALIPAVENAISGGAYHPSDIIITRKGISVEVTNTDAEGRLVLCDALAEAVSEKPDLLIDYATLTGAAKVALGPDLPALFTLNDELRQDLLKCAKLEKDPVWPLPIYLPYRELLKSQIADIINASMAPYAGAITAALFLKEFVPDDIAWVHFDMMCWNLATKPGRPEGGEAVAMRAVFRYLKERYQSQQ